jgi:hypothetical protein
MATLFGLHRHLASKNKRKDINFSRVHPNNRGRERERKKKF